MQFLRILVFAAVCFGTLGAFTGTFAKWGVPLANHPQGVQLRQDSVGTSRSSGFIFFGTRRRSYRGGGLSGGK
ncbi:MAG: hypothetical protein GY874_15440 [Desulfobacteraceae bacterium]|nr:hypothetical protein [Desulfobacteraceae bacterium]